MSRILSLFAPLLHAGVEQESHLASAKKIQLTNSLGLIIWIYCVFYTAFFYALGAPVGTVCIGAQVLLMPLVFYSNHRGWFDLARYLVIFFSMVSIFGGSQSFEKQYGEFLYIFPVSMLGLLLFDVKFRAKIFLCASIPLGLWVAERSFLGELIPMSYRIPLPEAIPMYAINFVGCYVLICAFCFLLFQVIGDHQERELQLSKLSVLGEVTSGVAHEIANPLAVILGKAQLIQKRANQAGDEKIAEDMSKIRMMAERINKISKGMTTLSRQSGGFEEVVFSVVLSEALTVCEEKIVRSGVTLERLVGEDYQIYCDPLQLSQVLLNLVNNAFHAVQGSAGAWIRIEAQESQTEDGSVLMVKITDSGQGIPLEVRSKMMSPFFTTKEKGKGTGLGLSISKGIVRDHGGRLYYNDQCSNTQFVIVLPLGKSEQMAA